MTKQSIAVVAGHFPGPEELREPEWRGTLDDFLRANPDLAEEAADIRDELFGDGPDGFYRIGGGAQGCFTLHNEQSLAELVRELDVQDCKVCLGPIWSGDERG